MALADHGLFWISSGRVMKKVMVALILLLWSFQAHAKVQFPDYVGFVNDFAKTLGDTSSLQQRLEEYNRDTGNQIVVVTVTTSDPLTPQQYAEELFDAWKPGQKGKDNGIIILNAVKERRVVIRTGYGLEGVLPDARTGHILDTAVIPHFKEDNPLLGLYSGVEAVIAAITPGKEKPVPEIVPSVQVDNSADIVPCENNPNVPKRAIPTQYIQDFEKGPNDDAQLQKLRDDDKVEMAIVGVDRIPEGISGRRLAECIAQNWNLGASLKRDGNGLVIVADYETGIAHVGFGPRLKDDIHASTVENIILRKSDEIAKPLAVSESLPAIVGFMGHYADDDWGNIAWGIAFGILGLGLLYLMGYLIYRVFRGLFAVCPKCHWRFPKLLKRKVTREATTGQVGIERRSYRCRHCGNEWVKVVTLATLIKTARWRGGSDSDFGGGASGSSGSGGFGGGSSGGGGADRGY